jgi:hypothetical protein
LLEAACLGDGARDGIAIIERERDAKETVLLLYIIL